jgi:competence ComEA-like helix-hairpin-helix protein
MESKRNDSAADGPNLRPAAVAALLVLLAALAAWGRVADERSRVIPSPAPAREARLCAGIEIDGQMLGLAFGESWPELAASAVGKLGLPAGCAPLVSAKRERGALLRFSSDGEGGCRRAEADVLAAPARLLCGAGLDVNRDAASDLELLPGVGPVKAGALVESRERDGPFECREDLERVRGIGPKIAKRIGPWLDGIE